jgi:hypothetical protein
MEEARSLYKIQMYRLTENQKDALILHLNSLAQARMLACNELINRLGPMPEPIADIFNRWSKACNDIELASEQEIKRICGEPDSTPEGRTIQ